MLQIWNWVVSVTTAELVIMRAAPMSCEPIVLPIHVISTLKYFENDLVVCRTNNTHTDIRLLSKLQHRKPFSQRICFRLRVHCQGHYNLKVHTSAFCNRLSTQI